MYESCVWFLLLEVGFVPLLARRNESPPSMEECYAAGWRGAEVSIVDVVRSEAKRLARSARDDGITMGVLDSRNPSLMPFEMAPHSHTRPHEVNGVKNGGRGLGGFCDSYCRRV